ncbi:YeiH family protein [Solibacillus sp. FSL H8-0538]|uniref:YeiH family protein n=1 Tax=Solibacillus sp. FSL H8-0538 TaxID=2921400 RepID=UPI0030F85538
MEKHQQNFIKGILFTFFIALAAYGIAQLPIISVIGPLAIAIILAIIIRNYIFEPVVWEKGITFSSKMILRLAIILYGVRLNMMLIFDQGLPFIGRAALVVAVGIGLMLLLSRLFGVDRNLALLLGCGTGICGAAAIGAVAPIIHSKDEDTALAVGMIALLGTIFALFAPVVASLVEMPAALYGEWVGFSVHEIAHAALAGGTYGDASLTPALMAKLSRVLLLFPVTLIIAWLVSRKQGETTQKASFPLFIVGFLIVSIISTIALENGWMTVGVQQQIASFASFLLTMSMAALGLTINLKQLQGQALKPLMLLSTTSVLLFAFTFWMV